MTYAEIIQSNSQRAKVEWWPKFAYHFTDITNALSILSTKKLFSRYKAEELHIMVNDNASAKVIGMTTSGATSYVRFYFRPMTPTQYYNEGYKHPQIRYDEDSNANVPVPIFFVFNLKKLLQDENTLFSPIGQAGWGANRYSGEEKFAKLDFDKIYSTGPVDMEDIKYRHAEILYPNEYSIDDSLEAIFCRNDAERTTLLNLLFEQDQKAYFTYRGKIRIGKENVFEKNGLYIDEVMFNDGSLAMTFSDTASKKKYARRQMGSKQLEILEPVELKVSMVWFGANNKVLKMDEASTSVDYLTITRLVLQGVPNIEKAKILAVKIYIDDKLMNYSQHRLYEEHIIK